MGDLSTVFGYSDWILADKNDDTSSGDGSILFTSAGPSNGDQSGNWGIDTLGTNLNVMVNLKAGNGWGSFLVDTLSGTWTSSKDLSHASIYYRTCDEGDLNCSGGGGTTPVPLPAGLPLILVGMGAFGVLRMHKKRS